MQVSNEQHEETECYEAGDGDEVPQLKQSAQTEASSDDEEDGANVVKSNISWAKEPKYPWSYIPKIHPTSLMCNKVTCIIMASQMPFGQTELPAFC
jgi:hypothetical protein